MNKINDRDIAELSSYWVYQDINEKKDFKVNGKRFKQIDNYNVKKKEFLSLIPNVTCNYIKTKLEELDNTLGKWEPFLNDLKAVSPILDNHLDDIVKNMKPLIVQMIFEPSHYDDMFILNTQAHARLDQMAQQFEVVCNGLNENEGQAIQTMDQSASLIRSNLIQVKEQLEKLAVY